MKTISLHVQEDAYSDFRSLADRRGQPVAELIREAMAEYLAHEPEREISLFDLAPHASGPLLELPGGQPRADLVDEMRDR